MARQGRTERRVARSRRTSDLHRHPDRCVDQLGPSRLDRRRRQPAASDRLILAGVLAAGATVATGWSDWADAEQRSPAVRRAGLVHAAVNGTATALMIGSFVARKRGARGRGKLLSLAGSAALGAGAGWAAPELHARRRGHGRRASGRVQRRRAAGSPRAPAPARSQTLFWLPHAAALRAPRARVARLQGCADRLPRRPAKPRPLRRCRSS